MKTVPKCLLCNYHYLERVGYDKKEAHWCKKGRKLGENRFIYASETKTSPKWCPLRETR